MLLFFCGSALADDHVASSASQADVQTAVDAASDGDRVLIPNGSATWTSGITTTKQIIIQAQNYTATPAGPGDTPASSRNVTITHNSSTDLFNMTSGSTYHVGIGGIEFLEGTGNANAIDFSGTGSKPPLLFDCNFENKERLGSAEAVALINWQATGGVIWNVYMEGTSNDTYPNDPWPDIASVSIHWKLPGRLWQTDSTKGDDDSSGNINVYVEDSTFVNCGGGDIDDHGRVVARHCYFDGTVWITHGFTSAWGGRHFELYNNTYDVTDQYRNHAGRYFWCRAGTGYIYSNVVNNAAVPANYGSVSLLDMGDNTTPSTYPQDRQMGGGYESSAYVVDPIRIWSNTGAQNTETGVQSSPDDWTTNVQEDRDFYVSSDATDAPSGFMSTGYTPYTYPHPLRDEISGGGSSASIETGSVITNTLTVGQ